MNERKEMSVVEKTKQESATLPAIIRWHCAKLWDNICSNCLAECEFVGEKTYAGRFVNVADVLKILEEEKPYVLTLCDKCNKEFQIEFEETVPEWVAVFARCPRCNHSNRRWLRIPKRRSV